MSRQFPALRGLAILLVVVNHSIVLSLAASAGAGHTAPPGWERFVLEALRGLGLIAVPTFLFISGGFMTYAVRGKDLRTGYRTVLLGLRHIVVPYLLWSLVFYVLVFALRGERYAPQDYLRNLAVGYPYNFVPIVVFFYIASPFLIRVATRHPAAVLVTIALYQVFTAAVVRPGLFGLTFPEWARFLTIPGLRLSIAIWGIFFPLGIVFGLHARRWQEIVGRLWWLLAAAAAVSYSLAVLHETSFVQFPLAGLLFPVFAVMMMPLLARDAIPFVETLEAFGKRAYGLYLTNLVFLNIALVAIQAGIPWLYDQLLLLVPLLVVFTILAMQFLVAGVARLPAATAQRYVLG
jgi:peptidoglycan/LPS O-acetylase OafA/YrhL